MLRNIRYQFCELYFEFILKSQYLSKVEFFFYCHDLSVRVWNNTLQKLFFLNEKTM